MARTSSALQVLLLLPFMCNGVRMDKLGTRMTELICPETAIRNTKGDCINEDGERIPQGCCTCSEGLTKALEQTDARLNLYMGECGVQRSDLAPGGKGVVDNTRICAAKCLGVVALKEKLEGLSAACKKDLAETPNFQQYEMLSQVVETLDSEWEECSKPTTTPPTTTEATTTKPTTKRTTEPPTTKPTPKPECVAHEDCGQDQYCAKGEYHQGGGYQKCDPIADCSQYNDAIDGNCPGTTLPPTTATTTTTVLIFEPIPEDEKNIVFVVDISGSMNAKFCDPRTGCGPPFYQSKSRLDLVKLELIRAINALPEDDKFMIVAFDHQAFKSTTRLVDATPLKKWEATFWIENLETRRGGTHYNTALLAALKHEIQIDSIHFLSDGEPQDCKELRCMYLARTFNFYNYMGRMYRITQRPKIYTTLFMPGDEFAKSVEPRELLKAMALKGGGKFTEPYPAEKSPYSVEKCKCKKNWGFQNSWGQHFECNDYCCNPDHEPQGDWCFFENDMCLGQYAQNWGYCDPDSM